LALLVLAVAAGCDVTAIHVDHGLRPSSAAEADVVRAAARRLGARVETRRVTVAAGPNLEARARRARFAVLPADVATGHTMDDQAETILVNLLRGAGADGLAGMVPGLRHPILGLRRHETHGLCAAAGLVPVCDESNDDPAFVRNRIRHELLPLCADVAGRDPVPLLARQAGVLRDEVTFLDALAGKVLPDPADTRAVAGAERPLARRALRRWLRESGTGEHPPSLAEVERTLAVAAGAAVGTEVAGGRRVRRTGGRLRVEPPRGSGKVTAVTLDESGAGVPSWAAADVGPVLVDAERVAARVAELGAEITADYADEPPLLVAVLKGAMLFMSDLCRAIALPVDVDFMAVSSYGSATKTSGVVRIVKDLDSELQGRHVLVVEDIIDSGLTLNYLRRYLNARQPKSVEICALLVKEGEQRVDLDLRYIGFSIPPEFVVGYGLDVAERYRNLRGIHLYKGAEA
jgi:hypoxanthine phosphoribosyltransferase